MMVSNFTEETDSSGNGVEIYMYNSDVNLMLRDGSCFFNDVQVEVRSK